MGAAVVPSRAARLTPLRPVRRRGGPDARSHAHPRADLAPQPAPPATPGPPREAKVAKFFVPEMVFGYDSLAEVGHAARRLGGRHVFLVTDPGIIEAGWAHEAQLSLKEEGLTFQVFHELTPNPKDHEVAVGLERYREHGCDVLVAVGGGSVIDTAKSIAVLSTNGGAILDYEGIDKVTKPIPPLVAAPTTSGTGADVSQFAVITDTTRRLKATLIGRALVPDISITDPRLCTTMPDWLNATTGLDALTHGIESYVSKAASFLTDTHALEAIRLVSAYLRRTLDAPADLAARSGMARASLTAGLAFTNAILGATHAMSHQIGGALDLPHGLLNGVLLPHVMRFNGEHEPQRYLPIAAALGIDTARLHPADAAQAAASAVRDLADRVGVPRGLADVGLRESDLHLFAEHTLDDACLTTNPRDVTADDIAEIFRAAL